MCRQLGKLLRQFAYAIWHWLPKSDAASQTFDCDVLAIFRMWTAREVFKAPQVQNLAIYLAHFSGVDRPSLTMSIIFLAKLPAIRP